MFSLAIKSCERFFPSVGWFPCSPPKPETGGNWLPSQSYRCLAVSCMPYHPHTYPASRSKSKPSTKKFSRFNFNALTKLFDSL